MMALQSAAEHYQRQRTLAAATIRDLRKVGSEVDAAAVINRYEMAAAALADPAAAGMLAEQAIPDNPVARVNPAAFMSGGRAAELVGRAATDFAVERVAVSLVQDAGRASMGVAIAARPEVNAHVRYLNPPSCSRCAILAGRVYRWSQGFQRHPFCDCVMVPTTMQIGPDLVSDPMEAFERGQVRGLSQVDAQAIRDGADMGQVVNVRRRAAGLTNAGEALTRAGRLTPAGVYKLAKNRDDAVALLRANGYLIGAPTPKRARRPLTLVRGTPAAPRPAPAAASVTVAPPKFGRTLTAEVGSRTTPLKGAGGKPLSRKTWDDAPFSRADNDFRYIANPDDRATGVLQYWTTTEQAAKTAAGNIKAGRSALDGIDLESGDFDIFLTGGYSRADLAADVEATAHKLLEWEGSKAELGTVFKGIQFDNTHSWDDVRAKLRSDDWRFSSVTPRSEHAHWYAGRPDRTRSVVFEIEDARGIRLDSVGDHAIEREYLVSGRIEILDFEMRADPDGWGDRLFVKARQVR